MAVCLCAATAARSADAHPTYNTVEVPRHLVAPGNLYFDATPAGFQAYLETVRTTNPDLYAQLAPDADRLETRLITARVVFLAGFAAGIATTIYGIASRKSCFDPPITDPNFAADTAAWAACDDANMRHMEVFGLVGIGIITAGFVSSLVVTPSNNEFLGLVNRHNSVSPQPLQLQFGYDPVTQLAHAGAAFTF
jgi:hypothetical protein